MKPLVLMLLFIQLVTCQRAQEHRMTAIHSQNRLALSMTDTIDVGSERDRLIVKETPAGFRVSTDSRRRFAVEASVELAPGQQRPPGEWPASRRIGERRILSRIDESEGGSGGTRYDLHAWEPYAGGYVLYGQSATAEEPSHPDFSLLWKVVEGTTTPDRTAEAER